MIVEIEGVVESAGEIENIKYGENKTFRKRTLIIKTDANFNALFPVDIVKDDCDKEVRSGDKITAECYLNGSGKLWNGKAFLSLTARDLNIKGQQNDSSAPTEAPF